MLTIRVRSLLWFCVGLAVTVIAVWSFTAWRASASIGPDESTFVPVTPVRILDTRDPTNVGLAGPFVSAVAQDLQVTGSIPTTSGTQTVVPAGSTGVVLNVTGVSPTANGFVSIRPSDAPGAPTTSSINLTGGDILPNAVTVELPTAGGDAGKIEITFDAYGTPGPTVDILIDVVGYTTRTGLVDLDTRLAALEASAVKQGDIVIQQATNQLTPNFGIPATVQNFSQGAVVGGNGAVQMSLTGPKAINGVPYGLKSVEYCITSVGATIDRLRIHGDFPVGNVVAINSTDITTAGCHTITVNNSAANGYEIEWLLKDGGTTRFEGVTSTWAPASLIPAVAATSDEGAETGDAATGD